jgi:hypothetical protein
VSGFSGTSGTIGSGGSAVTGTFLDLGGGDFLQDFTLPNGDVALLAFQWSSAFLEGGSPAANFQVTTDLDVYITNAAGTTIHAMFTTNNLNTDEAVELVTFLNNGSFGGNNFAVAYRLRTGTAPARVRWINWGDDIGAQGQGGPTIWAQAQARNVITLGAAPWYDPTTPEPFTGLGTNIEVFYDAAGNLLPAPQLRPKPEVTAPDALNTTFFGVDIPEDPDSLRNFFGTSAAAPAAAGAVALLLSEAGQNYTAAEVLRHLQRTALDIGSPGVDGLTGAGMIQLAPLPRKTPLAAETVLNDTSDRATNLGVLSGSILGSSLSILRHANGLFDYDWYQFTPARASTLIISLANIITLAPGSDLHFRLYVLSNGALHELGSSRLTGGASSQSLSVSVAAGQQLFLWVYGFNFAQGQYDLELTLL